MPAVPLKLQTCQDYGPASSYGPLTVQQNGSALKLRQIVNFVGNGISVSDNAAYYRSDISVGSPQRFANVAALRLASGTINGDTALTNGYYTQGDGGEGLYVWNASGTTADNGGTIIAPTGFSTGRWYLQIVNDTVNVKQFGAYGNGVANDQPAIQAAINWFAAGSYFGGTGGTVYMPVGVYQINSGITINNAFTRLVGAGGGTGHDGSAYNFVPATKIVWNGTSGGTMISVATVNNQTPMQDGIEVSHMGLFGNSSAGIGLFIKSIRNSVFTDIIVHDTTSAAYFFTCFPTASPVYFGSDATTPPVNGYSYTINTAGTVNWTGIGSANSTPGTVFIYNGNAITGTGGIATNTAIESMDTQKCIFTNLMFYQLFESTNASGFVLDSDYAIASDVSLCEFRFCGGSIVNGVALLIKGGDSNHFYSFYVNNAGGTSYPRLSILGADSNYFYDLVVSGANAILVNGKQANWVSGSSYVVGNLVQSVSNNYAAYKCISNTSGTLDPQVDPTHWQYITGYAYNPYCNRFFASDVGNGVPYPATISSGCYVTWDFNDGTMIYPKGVKSVMADSQGNANSIQATSESGTQSMYVVNGAADHVRLTDLTNSWGMSVDGNGNLRFTRFAGSGSLNIGNGQTAFNTGLILGGAGIGYMTGNGFGGATSQTSSKSTSVTLSACQTGQVTMNNAALGGGSHVAFAVINNAIASTDVVSCCVTSGGTANAYTANCTAVSTGQFTITVTNITGGSLSESPVITFVILKGSIT